MNIKFKILIFIISATILFAGSNEDCFRCHKSETLQLIDFETGLINSYHVSPEKFNSSNHKNLKCINCHTGNYDKWPHKDSIINKLNCVSCHSGETNFIMNNPDFKDKFSEISIKEINDEFEKSIHFKKFGDKFDCFSCHDPHSFQRNRTPSKTKILNDNKMCLNCHDTENNRSELYNTSMPELELSHEWLPNKNIHWESVRCIDCHSSYEETNLSHFIMKKESAVKNCESCHSKNSKLMSKLYKHEHKESKQKLGFINGTLINNAYVIGSTRNVIMDNLSFIIFGITFIGIFTHGFLRWKSKNNKSNKRK